MFAAETSASLVEVLVSEAMSLEKKVRKLLLGCGPRPLWHHDIDAAPPSLLQQMGTGVLAVWQAQW